MKKIIISTLTVVLIAACTKEVIDNSPKIEIPSYSKIISGLILPDDANQEVERIAEDVYQPDFTFGITDNPNYGSFSATPEYDIYMSGSTPAPIGLKLDGVIIPQNGGQWLHQSIDYKQYYGKNVEIELLNNGITAFAGNIYVPEPAKTPLLSANLHINRTGNTISWEVDQNNTANKIALAYSVYSTSDLNDLSGEIDRGVLLINNNGSYSIDHLLTNTKVQKIYFRLVTGNALATDIDGQKILFTIKTYDHHIYTID